MNKEPIGLYIFRFIMGFGLFAFMCMLYWSSLLIENNLKDVRREMAGLKNDIFSLRTDTDKIRDDIIRTLLHNRGEREESHAPGEAQAQAESKMTESLSYENNSVASNRPNMDPSLPNLLSEDPFYATTLPEMLGKGFKPEGTFHDATIGKPDDLHPFNNWAHISSWRGMCNVSLARMKFGIYETFAPSMAIKIEERKRKDAEVTEFWVHLRDDVYWQPLNERMFSGKVKLAPQFLRKHKVTAHDYKFFFDVVMNPYVQKPGAVALRNYIGDIEEIEVIDDLTLIVRWKVHEFKNASGKTVPEIKYVAKMWTGALTPLPGFVYKYFSDGSKIIEDDKDPKTYLTNSVWAQNFADHWAKDIIVSCGPWIFEEMTDRQISFHRNPDHFVPLDALVKGNIFEFKNSPVTIWQEFKSNKLDTYILSADQLIELDNFLKSDFYKEQEQKGAAIKKLEYNDNAYVYIGWNMTKPYFKSKKIRQAMTMAIDRERIIKQYLNGMGTGLTGPFSPFSSNYDHSIKFWPFDPQQARQILEEEGWYDSDGDGTLDKLVSGKRVPFEFSLTYYVKNPTTKAICEYVATALKEIGVKCNLNGVDLTDLSASFDDKGFDALCLAWSLGTPPEDPRQLWYSAGAKEPGSSNAVGFANKEADEIIEKLDFERNPEKRKSLYYRFHEIIHEEQPYTFLYTPKRLLLYREYVQNVFIPAKRQDLIPGADVAEPQSTIFWLKKPKG